MTIQDRIEETEKQFNAKNQERDNLLKQADDLLTELTKLQGEHRVLTELSQEPQEAEIVTKKGK